MIERDNDDGRTDGRSLGSRAGLSRGLNLQREGPEPRLTEGKRRVDPKTDGQTMRGKHPQSDVGFRESSAFARKGDSRNILARSVRGRYAVVHATKSLDGSDPVPTNFWARSSFGKT